MFARSYDLSGDLASEYIQYSLDANLHVSAQRGIGEKVVVMIEHGGLLPDDEVGRWIRIEFIVGHELNGQRLARREEEVVE